jgi:hypothetical protein
MCTALMRIAGNALAKLTDHEQAARAHQLQARYHIERMGKRR